MSLIERIPGSPAMQRVRYPVKRFSAPFLAGQYSFNQAANQNVLLMPLKANSVYLIERISFFAGAGANAEGNWLEGMPAEVDFPFFRLHYRNDDANSLYPEPVRCVNFVDGLEQLLFFWSTREEEDLLITFGGIVNQVAGMVGIDPLLAEVNFTMYQITDSGWNRAFIEAQGVFPIGSLPYPIPMPSWNR